MFFTQDDYRKIEEWLLTRTIKDSELPHADPLGGNEDVPIIQDGKNKTLTINELVKQVAMMELPDFFNVTTFAKKGNLFLEEAINCIPVEQRKLGLTITFHSAKGHWLIYQFKGTSLNQWSSLNYWRSPIEEALEELVLYPDEEDITGVRDGNRTFLKFKDKDYDPADFSGMGRIMLRKNLVGTEACSLDDEDHLLNVLTQDMIREENTVYIVQYDFDLDGKVISIPKGCTLWFQGGSINNGTIYLQETAILGAFEFTDIGNVKLFGKFNTGQVMTFSDESYKAKTGGYFVAGTKSSSATVEEDAKNEKETFYDKNPNAYTTQNRQELRWWNGEEWILILDITDYNEIKSIINDLIEKHNAEMSACYKYFKARLYALELKMDEAEKRIENHEERITTVEDDIVNIKEDITNIHNDITNIEQNITNVENNITDITNNITDILNQITNLGDVINNIDNIITEQIENYITNNVIGVASVTVNSTKYDPDENGNITLPDYPQLGGGQADSVKGTLTIKTAAGTTLASYNGSSDKTVTLPESGGGDTIITAKEPLTIKQGDKTLGTYDGTETKTISIPENTGGGTADKVAHKLKFTGASTAEYDGSTEVIVNIPTSEGSETPTFEPKTLTIKNANGEGVVSFNAEEDKEVQLRKLHVKTNINDTKGNLPAGVSDTDYSGSLIPYDIDLLKGDGTIDLTKVNFGTSEHGIVLASGYISRASNSSTVWSFLPKYKHPFITTTIASEGNAGIKITVSSAENNNYLGIHTVIATYSNSTERGITDTDWNRNRSGVIGLRCGLRGRDIYIQGIRTGDKYNDTIDFDPAAKGGKLLGFNILIIGHINR